MTRSTFMNPHPPDNQIYELTLLRHAESQGNADRVWQGQENYPLTESGRRQAQALAERWQREGVLFNLALSSPLSRARETAEIISSQLDVPMETDPIWMERDNGRLAGADRDAAAELGWPPPYLHPYMPIGETGESLWDLFLRGATALKQLLHRGPGRYLIVAHGGILDSALRSALGMVPQAEFRGAGFAFGNTGFAQLSYHVEHNQWRLWRVNDQLHLR